MHLFFLIFILSGSLLVWKAGNESWRSLVFLVCFIKVTDKILHGKQNVYIVFVICTSKFQRYIHLQQSALSIETGLWKHGLNPIFHIVIGEADSHPLSANETEFHN